MWHQVITCQLVAVSALKMCQDIKKKGTTTDGEGKPLNPMPFTAMLTNSVVWGLYGLGRRDFTSECATSSGQFKTQYNRNVDDRHVTGTVDGDTPLPCPTISGRGIIDPLHRQCSRRRSSA